MERSRQYFIPSLKSYQQIGVNLLTRTDFHIDKRTLPKTIFDDRCLPFFNHQFMTARVQNKLLASKCEVIAFTTSWYTAFNVCASNTSIDTFSVPLKYLSKMNATSINNMISRCKNKHFLPISHYKPQKNCIFHSGNQKKSRPCIPHSRLFYHYSCVPPVARVSTFIIAFCIRWDWSASELRKSRFILNRGLAFACSVNLSSNACAIFIR